MTKYATIQSWIDAADIGNIRSKIFSDYIHDGRPGGEVINSVCAPLSSNTGENHPYRTEAIRLDEDSEYWVYGSRLPTLADTSRMASYTNETRYWSEWYRRFIALSLMWGAFAQDYTREPQAPRVLLSIPAGVYTDADKLAKVKDNLYGKNGVHTVWTVGDKGKEIPYRFVLDPSKDGNVVIRAEGAGSYLRALVAELDYAEHQTLVNGLPPTTSFASQRVLVLAWGWLTLSIIGYDCGTPIKGLGKSNPYVGMSSMGLRLLSHIGNPFGVTPAQLNDWLVSPGDTISVNGKKYSGMVELRRQLARDLANEGINWAMSQKTATQLDFDALLVTGGTGEFLFGGRVRDADLVSLDAVPGGHIIKSPEAPVDDALGLWQKWDANRKHGV